MQMHNHMELIVEECVDHLIAQTGSCTCEKCRLDIMSIALNRLTPQYVVTETGALFAQLRDFDYQHKVDVTTALLEAIKLVREKPQH